MGNTIKESIQVFSNKDKEKVTSATLYLDNIICGSTNGSITIWKLREKKKIQSWNGVHESPILNMHILQKKFLLTASNESMKVWDVKTQECLLRRRYESKSYLLDLIVCQNERRFVACTVRDSFQVWDILKLKCISTVRKSVGVNFSACLNSKGSRIIYGADHFDTYLRIWDVRNRRLMCKIETGHADSIKSIQVSKDDLYIFTASDDNTFKLWKARSMRCLKTFREPFSIENVKILMSKSNKILVVCGMEGFLAIWDLKKLKCLKRTGDQTDGSSNPVSKMIISNDDKKIYTVDESLYINIWNLEKLLAT